MFLCLQKQKETAVCYEQRYLARMKRDMQKNVGCSTSFQEMADVGENVPMQNNGSNDIAMQISSSQEQSGDEENVSLQANDALTMPENNTSVQVFSNEEPSDDEENESYQSIDALTMPENNTLVQVSSNEEPSDDEENESFQSIDTLTMPDISMEISSEEVTDDEENESFQSSAILTSPDISVEEMKEILEKMGEKMSLLKSERDTYKLRSEQLNTEIVALRSERDMHKSRAKSFAEAVLMHEDQLTFYTSLQPAVFKYILDVINKDVEGHVKKLSLDSQLLLVLMKLKHDLKFQDLGYRFGISRRTVFRIFKFWLPILVDKLKCLINWPTKKAIAQNLPKCFKASIFRDTRVIIDCTEVFIQKPGNQTARSQTWSNYKHHHTLKFLVGISPSGHICFVSESFGGRSSDKEITLKSGFLAHIEAGDIVMADRGFKMDDYFALRGAKLVTPTFVACKRQLTLPQVMHSRNVSNVRIHVERVIKMLKRYIITSIIPITLLDQATDIVILCAALSNLCKPIVR